MRSLSFQSLACSPSTRQIKTIIDCWIGLFCWEVAAQLEMPFGTDDNDLPLTHFQKARKWWKFGNMGWFLSGLVSLKVLCRVSFLRSWIGACYSWCMSTSDSFKGWRLLEDFLAAPTVGGRMCKKKLMSRLMLQLLQTHVLLMASIFLARMSDHLPSTCPTAKTSVEELRWVGTCDKANCTKLIPRAVLSFPRNYCILF